VIAIPYGWTAHRFGDRLVLRPEDGEETMRIEYREAMRPLSDVREILAVGNAERLVTHEGEYAWLVRIDEPEARREIGVVLGDADFSLFTGVAVDPTRFDELSRTVRTLVLSESLMLGVRRRRYLYQAPVGWTSEVCGHEIVLRPEVPETATATASIRVLPAWPAAALSHGALQELIEPDATSEMREMETPPGLSGSMWTTICAANDGTPRQRMTAILSDDRYAYPVRFEADDDEQLWALKLAFERLVESVEPLPRPLVSRSLYVQAFAQWAE
jgi:hypothetical protein